MLLNGKKKLQSKEYIMVPFKKYICIYTCERLMCIEKDKYPGC